tara:strand:- start:3289 stop:3732 length:444 start_codon:yes stop_codon:yes gene_type:complete
LKALIQRVRTASVIINNKSISKINIGLLIFLGVHKDDDINDVIYLVKKTCSMRIFPDKNNKINYSIKDIKGSILVVSQFTLCANIKKGNRPSFANVAQSKNAKKLYLQFCNNLRKNKIDVSEGIFGKNMDVQLINDGPFTIYLNSKF